MDKTNIKNAVIMYGGIALLSAIGVSFAFLLPIGQTADRTLETWRAEQASLDRKVVELKPLYEEQRLIFTKAQEQMARIEEEARGYREQIARLQVTIEEARDGKKE